MYVRPDSGFAAWSLEQKNARDVHGGKSGRKYQLRRIVVGYDIR